MQVWPSKTLLQRTRGALLEKCLTTIGSLGWGGGGSVGFSGVAFEVFLSKNVLKIASGRQNVRLLWLLFKLFLVLYALGFVLGEYMHILP